MQYIQVLVKLRKIIRSINIESKKIEKQFGISIPQLMCLQFLSDQTDYKATASSLKEYLKLNASTISGIISRLELKGLVAKLPHKDGRASYITLTAKGAELLKEPPITLQDKLMSRLSNLSEERISELESNIDLLIDIMDAEDIDASPIITTQDKVD
ncbi:MAG: MarR family transcriptional regulator [Saprospiraceae bacterium]